MKTKALDDKLAQTLTEFKDDKLVTLLSEIKAEELMDTLAASLTDVQIETVGETVFRKYAEALISKLGNGVKLVDGSTVNETVTEVKSQPLGDTGRH